MSYGNLVGSSAHRMLAESSGDLWIVGVVLVLAGSISQNLGNNLASLAYSAKDDEEEVDGTRVRHVRHLRRQQEHLVEAREGLCFGWSWIAGRRLKFWEWEKVRTQAAAQTRRPASSPTHPAFVADDSRVILQRDGARAAEGAQCGGRLEGGEAAAALCVGLQV